MRFLKHGRVQLQLRCNAWNQSSKTKTDFLMTVPPPPEIVSAIVRAKLCDRTTESLGATMLSATVRLNVDCRATASDGAVMASAIDLLPKNTRTMESPGALIDSGMLL